MLKEGPTESERLKRWHQPPSNGDGDGVRTTRRDEIKNDPQKPSRQPTH
jgi:hypothetical protein